MKLFVTYENPAIGIRQIDKIFNNRYFAQRYIIRKKFKGIEEYKGKLYSKLRTIANLYLEEYQITEEVVGW
jgi:hypothetical protein